MTDVFVRVCPLNQMRLYLSCASLLRWGDLKNGKLRVLVAENEFTQQVMEFLGQQVAFTGVRPEITLLPMANFWTTSKQAAEDLASGDVYVFADDDHLPIEDDWVDVGTRLMRIHKDFALLSGLSMQVQGGVRRMNVALDGTGEVIDGCVGAPYFMRKGAIGRFPECTIKYQDGAMCDQLRARGWRVGHALFCRYNHTAGHLSTALNYRAVGGPVGPVAAGTAGGAR